MPWPRRFLYLHHPTQHSSRRARGRGREWVEQQVPISTQEGSLPVKAEGRYHLTWGFWKKKKRRREKEEEEEEDRESIGKKGKEKK